MATIQEIMALSDFAAIKKELAVRPTFAVTSEDAKAQYNVNDHKVFSTTERPDKIIKRPTGVLNDDGTEQTTTGTELVTRVGLGYQKLIVDRSVGFMLGNPVKIKQKFYKESEQGKKLFTMVDKLWDDNKMDMVLPEVAERFFSEMEVALIFYFVEEEGYWGELSKNSLRLKFRVCSPELGDNLYPHYDSTGDMDAFSRGYNTTVSGKKVEHFDIYTADGVFKYEKGEGGWLLVKPEGVGTSVQSPGKIMAVYINCKKPDWADVQSLIDRLEMSQSNHGDTNDYNGSPILFTKGAIKGAPAKGSRGKALSGEDGSDAKYLAWDSAPESIKLEFENLRNAMFELSQTPDSSFSSLKDVGANIATATLELMFTDAHMKARKNWRTFGIGVQRILNIMKAATCRVVEVGLEKEESNLQLTPICIPYLPKNAQEIASMVDNSVDKGSISKRTAYENHPLISDADQEEERVKVESGMSLEASVR